MTNGWPLGLESMNMRLRVLESLQDAAAETYPFHVDSTSFSTFSSSDLDTGSTRSFFQDHSVPLGRLLGIRPEDRGDLYFTNSIRLEERERPSVGAAPSHASRGREVEMSQGICIPLLLCILVKISPSRNSSRG